MDCSCVYVDMDDGPEFEVTTMRTARKEHKCVECRRIILPKESYEHVQGKWEGEMSTFKTCLDCLSIRNAFFCNGYLFSCLFEYLEEHIYGSYGTISTDSFEKLTPKAKQQVIDMISKAVDPEYDENGNVYDD